MKLAAIDIGTNSIHMVIVEATGKYSFEVIDREKEMVKLGVGVFATNQLSEQAFRDGLETIRRYVQLADRHGQDADRPDDLLGRRGHRHRPDHPHSRGRDRRRRSG